MPFVACVLKARADGRSVLGHPGSVPAGGCSGCDERAPGKDVLSSHAAAPPDVTGISTDDKAYLGGDHVPARDLRPDTLHLLPGSHFRQRVHLLTDHRSAPHTSMGASLL